MYSSGRTEQDSSCVLQEGEFEEKVNCCVFRRTEEWKNKEREMSVREKGKGFFPRLRSKLKPFASLGRKIVGEDIRVFGPGSCSCWDR